MTERRHLADQVTATVRDWIRTGELDRGELYSVHYVAERLDVSRSPAREGLLALAEAGLIEFRRNRGFRVVVPDGRQVAEIFALRLALEPAAAALAARNADATEVTAIEASLRELYTLTDPAPFAETDQRLHAQIMVAAGNPRALHVVDGLRDLTRTLGPSSAGHSRTLSDIADEHRPVVDAIGIRDATRARRTMSQHLIITGRLLVAQCAEAGDSQAWTAWRDLVDEDS